MQAPTNKLQPTLFIFSSQSLYISAKSFKQYENYTVITFCFFSEGLQRVYIEKHVPQYPPMIKCFTCYL